MISALARLHTLDTFLFHAAAHRSSPNLDRVLPRLTHSADHGLLWYGVSAALAAGGQRRAAVRGLASLALASAIANVPIKLATRRSRPHLQFVPLPRQLLRQPTTSSFPSGHSTSAAAFAVGVGLEQPALAVPVGLLAAGVAYGRVHTGVHYPGDVVAGLALGAGCAVAVRRIWPVRPSRPAASPPAHDAPALPTGEGLVLVINLDSRPADDAERTLAELLPRAEIVRSSGDLDGALRKAASHATVLGVMGGDGTVSAAAGTALERELPLAVFPGGTLNHFAGELGISDMADAVEAVRTGSAVRVSVGTAGDGLLFLNTFALGVYPDLVKEREARERRIGKWPAMAWATVRLLRRAEAVTVTLDGEQRSLWTLFVGNGQYHPSGFAPSWRERMDSDCLDLRVIDAVRPWARTRLGIAFLTGLLGRSRVYEERLVATAHVTADAPLRVARDGEVSEGPRELVLRTLPEPLVVYRP